MSAFPTLGPNSSVNPQEVGTHWSPSDPFHSVEIRSIDVKYIFKTPLSHSTLTLPLSLQIHSPTTPMSHPAGPFEQILQVFATADHYTIGSFLMEFFRAPQPRSRATGRSERHGKMLSAFLRGATSYSVGEVLCQLDAVARRFRDPQEPLYTLTTPYKSLKSGCAALTSYAAQKVSNQLSAEQRAAVDPEGGLHVFAPHGQKEPINMRLNWDTYGATTFEDVRAILVRHQPLTFDYIQLLSTPERHDPEKGYRYRPPGFVRQKSISYI